MTLLVVQPRSIMLGATAKAAVADTYRQLNLFGDVFERVRADYVEKPDDSKLIESAINGMLAGLVWNPPRMARLWMPCAALFGVYGVWRIVLGNPF